MNKKERIMLEMNSEQIKQTKKLIEYAKKALENKEDAHAAESAAGYLRDVPLMKEAGLYELAYMLNHGEYGTHKNDVLGLIENIEQLIEGKWSVLKSDYDKVVRCFGN